MFKVYEMIVFRREFDDNGILFNPDDGKTFGLNPVAVIIWESLEKGLDKPAIYEVLKERVADLPDCAAADIDEFIAALQEQGFLSIPENS